MEELFFRTKTLKTFQATMIMLLKLTDSIKNQDRTFWNVPTSIIKKILFKPGHMTFEKVKSSCSL